MKRTILVLSILVLIITACGGGVGNAGPIVTRGPSSGDASSSPDASQRPSTGPTSEPSGQPIPPTSPPAGTAVPTDAPSDRPDPTDEGPSDETMSVKVYFMLDDVWEGGDPALVPVARVVPRTVAVGGASMRALLDGPTAAEREGDPLRAPMSSAIPAGTLFLGLDIQDGLATVDLSREFESGGGSFSMGARLAQVVYTLTQFPTVDRVNFRLDGEPVTVFSGEGLLLEEPVDRDDYVDYLPAILVDSPAFDGTTPAGPLRIEGVANVFEAQFMARLEDADGNVLQVYPVMARCGSGCWGAFGISIGEGFVESGDMYLTVYEPSAMDGGMTNVRRYPVHIGGAESSSDSSCGC